MSDEEYIRRLSETNKIILAPMLSQLRARAVGQAIGVVLLLGTMIYLNS